MKSYRTQAPKDVSVNHNDVTETPLSWKRGPSLPFHPEPFLLFFQEGRGHHGSHLRMTAVTTEARTHAIKTHP